MTETSLTDISDKTFEELRNADRSILQSLAGERDELDGRAASDEIVVGLFELEGREDEIPEEYHEGGEIAVDASDGSGRPASDDEGPDDEPEAEEEADDDAQGDSTFIAEAAVLQDYINHVSALVKEAKVRITDDGLQIRAVDPANVGMIDTTIEPVGFESYNTGGDGIIGINVKRVQNILKRADDGQLVSIDYDATRRNLVVQYGGHEFTLALIDPDSIRKEPDLPDLDLPVRVEMDTDDLKDAIDSADMVTDHVRLRAYSEGNEAFFEIHGEGDTDDYTWTGGDDDVTFISPPGNDAYLSVYSLDYLKDLVRTYDRGDTVTIDLGQEFPTVLTVALRRDGDDEEEDVGTVTYMLAPRITAD